MSNTSPLSSASSVDAIYTQLKQHDIEQFYTGYQLWNLQQQIVALQCEIDALQQQIRENAECLQEVQPSAIALATLARLQANGVSDLDLLDRLLEQGEIWLDRMMQRLDYCEQLDDFIRDDYTQWCTHALEGAYDWIDSIQEGSPAEPLPVATEETLTEPTEELFLQKLASDEDGDEASMLGTTVKRPAITAALAEEDEQAVAIEQEAAPTPEEQAPISEEPVTPEIEQPAVQEQIMTDSGEATPAAAIEEPALQEQVALEEPEPPSQSEEPVASATVPSDVEKHEAPVQASSPEEGGQQQQSTRPKRRPNFFGRLVRKVWGS